MPTKFQSNLYHFVVNYLHEYQGPPSFAEMVQAMGIGARSKSLITRSLQQLKNEGKVELTREGRRLLISVPSINLKVLGRVSAGPPLEAVEQHCPLDLNSLFQGEGRFAFQVKGTSMIDEGVLDGDILVCQKTALPKEGDRVVALIDHQKATLKHISYQIKGMITLRSADPGSKPHIYCAGRISVQGVYLGLVRMHC